jgi:hypothetical protein
MPSGHFCTSPLARTVRFIVPVPYERGPRTPWSRSRSVMPASGPRAHASRFVAAISRTSTLVARARGTYRLVRLRP